MDRQRTVAVILIYFCIATHGLNENNEVCSHGQSSSVRLAGFNSSYVGYLQVCKEGYWTAIAFEEEQEWTRKNSIVACRELGFDGAVGIVARDGSTRQTTSDRFNSLSPREFYSVECTGLEEYLIDCVWSIKTMKSSKNDVIVMCTEVPLAGDVSLVGISGKDSEGIVLVYNPLKTYSWSSLCTAQWDDVDADVTCKQLGFKGGASTSYSSEQEVRSKNLPRKRYSSFECSGSESVLFDCSYSGPYPYQCNSHQFAGVVCVETEEEDTTILNLNISLLAFMIVISVLLIFILSLLLRCTINKFRKTPTSRECRHLHGNEAGEEGRMGSHTITRTRLDHDMPYALLTSSIAPPSYEDTLLADEVVQGSELNTECEGTTSQQQVEEEEQNSSPNSSTNILPSTDEAEDSAETRA